MHTRLLMTVGEDPLAPSHSLLRVSTDSFLLFGAIGLVVLGLLVWAYLYYSNRREGRHRHHHHHHHGKHHHHHHDSEHAHRDASPGEGETTGDLETDSDLGQETGSSGEEAEASHTRRYRRRRRRRREHRPRNPTLAETGGLPPVRTDAPPGP